MDNQVAVPNIPVAFKYKDSVDEASQAMTDFVNKGVDTARESVAKITKPEVKTIMSNWLDVESSKGVVNSVKKASSSMASRMEGALDKVYEIAGTKLTRDNKELRKSLVELEVVCLKVGEVHPRIAKKNDQLKELNEKMSKEMLVNTQLQKKLQVVTNDKEILKSKYQNLAANVQKEFNVSPEKIEKMSQEAEVTQTVSKERSKEVKM